MPGAAVDRTAPSPDIELFAQLLPYLCTHGVLEQDEQVVCARLTGGVSNKTVRVARSQPPHLVIKQALPKLRVPVDWFSSPLRIHREFAALQVFAHLLPGQVPQAVFQDHVHHIIAISEIPRPYVNWKTAMMQGDVALPHWQEFGRMLARLHGTTAGNPDFIPQELHDRTYFRSLRLEPYYEYTGTQVRAAQGFLQSLVDETLSHRLSLVHGDYSPKNVLLSGNRLFLLDFEVCHVGDPAFDVGFALTHALSKGHYLAQQRKQFQQAGIQFWQAYREASRNVALGSAMEVRCIRHTLACLLARAAGRSPLEYLDEARKSRQIRAVLSLMDHPPLSVPQLVQAFLSHIDR